MLESLLFEWTISMFSYVFSMDTSTKLWDLILCHGDWYIIKIAVAVLAALDEISDDQDLELLEILPRIEELVTEENLLISLKNLKFNEHTYISLFSEDNTESIEDNI